MRTKHTPAHDPQPRHRVNRLLMRARTGGGQRINAVSTHFRYRNYLGFLYIAEVSFLYMWISYIAGGLCTLYSCFLIFFIPYFSILRAIFLIFVARSRNKFDTIFLFCCTMSLKSLEKYRCHATRSDFAFILLHPQFFRHIFSILQGEICEIIEN